MTRQSLDLLRQRYVVEGRPLEASVERNLRADARAGARAIVALIDKRRSENRSEGQRLRKMLRFETSLWESGCHAVAGVDEAGMSPLAGPVSAAAVILKPGTRIVGVDDSKNSILRRAKNWLRKSRRKPRVGASRSSRSRRSTRSTSIGRASGRCSVRSRDLASTPQHLLIDAKRLKEIDIPQQAIIKGDAKSASIAAASILAKVERDAVMRMLDARHPGYGFADHKGYPVKEHYAALDRLGACAAHRRSFGPVRKALGLPPLPPWPSASERAAG